jgi:hypothetical protein
VSPQYAFIDCYRLLRKLLSLYLDHHYHLRDAGEWGNLADLTPQYFREVLLSYCLIFGQNKASWKALRKRLSTYGEHWDRSDKQSNDGDPMLRILCCSSYMSAEAKPIYEAIDASDRVSPYYYPDLDFPFLGRRLLILQAFASGISARHSQAGMAAWQERRRGAFWWTLWVSI